MCVEAVIVRRLPETRGEVPEIILTMAGVDMESPQFSQVGLSSRVLPHSPPPASSVLSQNHKAFDQLLFRVNTPFEEIHTERSQYTLLQWITRPSATLPHEFTFT